MPRTNRDSIEAIAEAAACQFGLVTAAQLAEAGFARSTLQWRIRQGGPWTRVLPGIYLLSAPPMTSEQRLEAAVLFAGPDVALTGRTALALHGVVAADRVPDERVHLLVPHRRKRTSHGFVHVERTTVWPTVTSNGPFPTTALPRAAIDACRRLSRRSDVEAVLTEVIRKPGVSLQDLTTELDNSQRRRSALAREVLKAMGAGPASVAELDLYRRWTRSGLPTALWNADLLTPDGDFLARPDVYLPDLGIAVEVDSLQFHYSRSEWEATMRRHARMTSLGILVIHVTPTRIQQEWPSVAHQIRTAVEVRTGHVPPAVLSLRSVRAG